MKRFYLFCLLVLISFPIQAKNKISMVTYFPVPYVAYSQVNTTDQMDIGLTSACDMKLGCSETSATLNATRVNLKGGKLNLDGGRGIKGYTLSLGNGNGEGRILFQNVRIQTGNMESVNAADIKAANLNLFGKTFPSCKAANGESDGQMQWSSLKLKGASSNELYLMCGDFGASTEPEKCQPTDPRGETFKENCPSGQTGGPITYTWDYFSCKYRQSGFCTAEQYTCITSYNWKSKRNSNGEPSGPSSGGTWRLINWDAAMTCDGSDVNPSTRLISCKPGEECDCTPGEYYLYIQTYGCKDSGIGANSKWGWYCAKCGRVSSKSECAASVEDMGGKSCSEGGGGKVDFEIATNP